jgi:hypothetical protein
MKRIALLFLLVAGWSSLYADDEGDWSGWVSAEYRYFTSDPLYPEQEVQYWSLAAQPEYYRSWDGGDTSFTFTPFVRWDHHDDERSYADIRELHGFWYLDDWQVVAGISRVFWGVTESVHLVDIINQTATLEGVDGEEKLGQPMIHGTLSRDWGDLDLFVLFGFRERQFAGEKGRIRSPLIVDTDNPVYESSRENRHIDYAARWSRSFDIWDVGLSYFYGTSRDARLEPGLNDDGNPVLIPFYDIINQASIDAQVFLGDWTWKLEALNQRRKDEIYSAAVGGFEYTFVGLFESSVDLGTLIEYSYDSRGNAAPVPFERDIFFGLRLTPNDAASTEFLAGVIYDTQGDGEVYRIEASRRFFESWKVSFEAQSYSGIDQRDPVLYPVRDDDYLQLDVAWYF